MTRSKEDIIQKKGREIPIETLNKNYYVIVCPDLFYPWNFIWRRIIYLLLIHI